MSDYYLRATDEAAMNAALNAAAVIDSEGNPFPGMDLSVIGVIEKPTGQIDADGYPVTQPLPGFHVNLRTTVELLDSQVEELPTIDPPQNPVRVWFDHAPQMGVVETVPQAADEELQEP
jgi:hypothetical protein